jgi:hypothetical protein
MKTQTTKPGWGIVALASLMVAGTCFGSFWLSLTSLTIFAFSAWKGGYMTGECGMQNDECGNAKHSTKSMQDAERRAA